MADMDEVAALLHIYEKASAHGDLLKNISNSAMEKLKAINAEHGRPAEPVPEPEPLVEPNPVTGEQLSEALTTELEHEQSGDHEHIGDEEEHHDGE